MRTNKKIGILLATLLAVSLFLFGCSDDGDVGASTDDGDVNNEENNGAVNEEDNGDNAEVTEKADIDIDEIITMINDRLPKFNVIYDADIRTFILESTDDTFTSILESVISGEFKEGAWEAFPEHLLDVSEEISETAGEHDYAFAIRNPIDEKTFLTLIMEDDIIYDFIDDL